MVGDNIIYLLTGVKGIMGFAGPEDRNVAGGRRIQQSALVIKNIIQYPQRYPLRFNGTLFLIFTFETILNSR